MTTGLRSRLTRGIGGIPGLLILAAAVLIIVLVRNGFGLLGAPGSALPSTVGGLPVMTVSEVLAGRSSGGLDSATIALGGFWSSGLAPHSCAPPDAPTGELEIYCHDGEYGITELDEPIMVIDRHGYATVAQGPKLTPWFPKDLDGLAGLFALPTINGQWYPPVPIVVVGHFDDTRTADCRPQSRRLCMDRLVVDRIALFDPGAVPTPGVTPTPTPFPSPAPPGMFGPEECGGNVEYSFIGWTTTAELPLPFQREGHVWAMVTAVPVLLGGEDWNDDPDGSGVRFRWWGNRICIAEEGQLGVMEFGVVPGTSYREWEDGRKTPGEP